MPALVEAGEGEAPPSRCGSGWSKHRTNAGLRELPHRIDPMGFALENFDAIGRYRTTEFGLPIDATGAFPDGSQFKNPAEFRTLLSGLSEQFVNTVTVKLLTYAARPRCRGLTTCRPVRKIMREAAAKDYRWSALIMGIVNSTPFQMNRSTAPATTPTEAVARP